MSFHLLSSYFSSLIFYTIYETISNNTFQVGEIQHRVEEFCYFVFACTTKPILEWVFDIKSQSVKLKLNHWCLSMFKFFKEIRKAFLNSKGNSQGS